MCKRLLYFAVNIGMISIVLLFVMILQQAALMLPFNSFVSPSANAAETLPLVPDASVGENRLRESLLTGARSALERPFYDSSVPEKISIPSVDIDSWIQPVGLDKRGAMDVPGSKTNNVGWYKNGTVPGHVGSAVMAAHVNAAFEPLKNAKIGDDVYVDMADGSKLHFVITDSMRYHVQDVPEEFLFDRQNGKFLHLVTCIGRWDSTARAYDERLIVYATLVE